MNTAPRPARTRDRSPDRSRDRTRPGRIWFGPGTILALSICGGALLLSSLKTGGNTLLDAGRIAFESDGQGHMKRVATGGIVASRSPLPPLMKPEPGLLQEHVRDLALTDSQQRSILAADSGWRTEKSRIVAALRDASTNEFEVIDQRSREHAVSLNLLKHGLGEYSSLSRQYDSIRAEYWLRATSVLNGTQRAKVALLLTSADSRRAK